MKQSLQLKLKQQLRLTPQLQQAIKLLQLSSIELQQELHRALEENPLLEIQEDTNFEKTEHITDSNQQADSDEDKEELQHLGLDEHYSLRWEDQVLNQNKTDWDEHNTIGTPSQESLQQSLSWQLHLSPCTNKDRWIAEFIIDAIQDNGRLGEHPRDIFNNIKQDDADPLEFEEFEVVRHFIQQLSPTGCASYNLQECLHAQLSIYHQHYDTCHLLIEKHLDLLSEQDTKKLSRLTHIPEHKIVDSLEYIKNLNPYPGNNFHQNQTNYIVPDVILHKKQNRWQIELNPELTPKLSLNTRYLEMLRKPKEQATQNFVKEKLQDAKTFISSIENRNSTLLTVSQAILEKQIDFFEEGAHKMKPLTLQSIAEQVNMHESTISRITNQKYMSTPKGTFELKYFFSSQLGDSDNTSSSIAVQALIKKLIAQENVKKPLSDSKIAQHIWDNEQIKVARRTISKYREQLAIPPSNERKKLN